MKLSINTPIRMAMSSLRPLLSLATRSSCFWRNAALGSGALTSAEMPFSACFSGSRSAMAIGFSCSSSSSSSENMSSSSRAKLALGSSAAVFSASISAPLGLRETAGGAVSMGGRGGLWPAGRVGDLRLEVINSKESVTKMTSWERTIKTTPQPTITRPRRAPCSGSKALPRQVRSSASYSEVGARVRQPSYL